MRLIFTLLLAMLFAGTSNAQGTGRDYSRKHQFYFYWGWNRAWYTNSDIRFNGDTYDFTLSDVVATDRQTDFAPDPYLNPTKLTIPQTNARLGYFFSDDWSISLGVDHMKYVMVQNQTVKINGYINNTNTDYNKVYNNEPIVLKEDFLMFEHTDGLNYINTEVRRMGTLINMKNKNKVQIDYVEGLGLGILFPRTNTTLLGNNRYDEFHVAGYGMSAVVGVNFTFFKYFFIQSEVKGGFINMPDIRTTEFSNDHASQHFLYLQTNAVLGVFYKFGKRQDTSSVK